MLKSFFRSLKRQIPLFNGYVERFLDKKYVRAWCGAVFSAIFFGSSLEDYIRYEFYRKSWAERRKFITHRKSLKLIKKYNSSDGSVMCTLYSKPYFNRHFADYVKRDWLDMKECTAEQFAEFVKKYGYAIVKPRNGYGGKGIFVVSESDLHDGTVTEEDWKDCIVEELLVQHETINKLNPSSVNSLRVMTFDGEIISTVLKIGGGKGVVDNMSSGGVYGNVNLEYGITDSKFYDIELHSYMFHPVTGEQLIGVQIPHWDKVVETVKSAAMLLPECRYLGWDIAVLENDVAIIEANYDPGHDLSCQSTEHRGILPRIKAML